MSTVTKKCLIFMSLILLLSSCSMVSSSFTPEAYTINSLPKKNSENIECFSNKPTRAALRIGLISVNGNAFSNFSDLIKGAKRKAGILGGDFIMMEDQGLDRKEIYSPGYFNYQGKSSKDGSFFANGYSVGPHISTIARPWSVFSVWVYCPSQLGLRFDENLFVKGFHMKSDAEDAGIKIGDRLVGIDGYDIGDQAAISYLMKIQSGTKVELTFRRDGKKLVFSVTAIPNL